MGCVVIMDQFGDVHATQAPEPCTPEAIEEEALDLAESLAFNGRETVKVGLCAHNDPGAARLLTHKAYEDGGVEWLYDISVYQLRVNSTKRGMVRNHSDSDSDEES
jgi:hypothetical protein